MSPLCESFLPATELDSSEVFYPLRLFVCSRCLLVQLREYVSADAIFTEYAYFSSYSDSWVAHARDFASQMTARLGLTTSSWVVELGSNDGYLLQHFVQENIPSLGIEPAANVAAAARDRGVPTLTRFFGWQAARELTAGGRQADLIVGNNVLAQVPDLADFLAGVSTLLGRSGTLTLEFPHLLRLIERNQFDTIYHEHFWYFSLLALVPLLARHGLRVVDVEELATHGGSIRVFAQHEELESSPTDAVARLVNLERDARLDVLSGYDSFRQQVEHTKRSILRGLADLKDQGKRIVGYGAPGKGNTLLNYCGIRQDFLDYTVDRNPYKHGKFLPGTRIPIFSPERIAETKPDYIFILPWNLREEIVRQLDYTREWGCKFIVPIPTFEVLS
jgi:hypothetical protein